jgi:hypothetical protein
MSVVPGYWDTQKVEAFEAFLTESPPTGRGKRTTPCVATLYVVLLEHEPKAPTDRSPAVQ